MHILTVKEAQDFLKDHKVLHGALFSLFETSFELKKPLFAPEDVPELTGLVANDLLRLSPGNRYQFNFESLVVCEVLKELMEKSLEIPMPDQIISALKYAESFYLKIKEPKPRTTWYFHLDMEFDRYVLVYLNQAHQLDVTAFYLALTPELLDKHIPLRHFDTSYFSAFPFLTDDISKCFETIKQLYEKEDKNEYAGRALTDIGKSNPGKAARLYDYGKINNAIELTGFLPRLQIELYSIDPELYLKEAIALFKLNPTEGIIALAWLSYISENHIHRRLLDDYFAKTLPVAQLKKGLWSPQGGRYEQAGYPMRAMAYIASLICYFDFINDFPSDGDMPVEEQLNTLNRIILNNDATYRPLLDNHSIPLVLAINFLMKHGRTRDAVTLLRNAWAAIIIGYRSFKRLPDGRNRVESVIQLMVTNKKSIYYEDRTSHLLAILLEYLAVFDLKDDYDSKISVFLKEINIDLAVFVPFNDPVLTALKEIAADQMELALFDHTLIEGGYQSEVSYSGTFDEFKQKTASKNEFNYNYRTTEAGFEFLLPLAHVYFETPLFSDFWRHKINK